MVQSLLERKAMHDRGGREVAEEEERVRRGEEEEGEEEEEVEEEEGTDSGSRRSAAPSKPIFKAPLRKMSKFGAPAPLPGKKKDFGTAKGSTPAKTSPKKKPVVKNPAKLFQHAREVRIRREERSDEGGCEYPRLLASVVCKHPF